jgi:hypothetical protein
MSLGLIELLIIGGVGVGFLLIAAAIVTYIITSSKSKT